MSKKDENFWEGFDYAIELVYKVFENSQEKEAEGLLLEIEEEIMYHKRGD